MTVPGDAGIFPVRPGFLLAHQGGWDEILLVVGPLAVVGLLLWLANRRVSAQLNQAESEAGEATPTPAGNDRSGPGNRSGSDRDTGEHRTG